MGIRSFGGRAASVKIAVAVAALAAVLAAVASPPAGAAEDFFVDDNESVHEDAINFIAALGITRGCNPPANTEYCPTDFVTRGQMAAFIGRTLSLRAGAGSDLFDDDDGSIFENDIDRLATAGITRGCNPPANTNYCPTDRLTRAQMATFIKRMLDLPSVGEDFFDDDDGNIHEANINAIAELGITRGCNPPANTNYCPNQFLTREQMATFLSRVIEILRPDLVAISNRTMAEGTTLTIAVTVREPFQAEEAEDAIELTVSGLPDFAAFSDNGDGTGALAFSPGFQDAGAYPITVTATRLGYAGSRQFTVNVTDVNKPPVITPLGDRTSGEGSVVALQVVADDPDEDPLDYSATGLPGGLSIDTGSGLISGTVSTTAADDGPGYAVTVTVSDQGTPALEDSTSFTWTIVDTNRNPSLAPLADQTDFEGDTGISVDLSGAASDPDPGDTLTFGATGLPPGLAISGAGLITGDLSDDAGGVYPVTVTVTDDGVPVLSAERIFTWTVAGPDATLLVTPGNNFKASTRDVESMTLSNGSRGGVTIDQIAIDVSTAAIPDYVWDPEGTGGDAGFGCLTVNAADATAVGFTPGPGVPPCQNPFFSGDHEGGWDVLTMTFDDFEPGEELKFWVETDPTSIKDVGGEGLVSGMELTGATVTVTFSSGEIVTELFNIPGDFSGGRAIASLDTPGAVPAISVETLDGTLSPATWDASHAGSDVDTAATSIVEHTVRVTGPEGATVRLIAIRALMVLFGTPGFDVEPFEANFGESVELETGVISGGFVDLDITLTDNGKFYYLIATIVDDDGDGGTVDATGRTSNVIVLRQDGGNVAPVFDPTPDQTNGEGDAVSLQLTAVDPDATVLTYSVVVDAVHDALPAGLTLNATTGLISGTISSGAAGTYDIRVRVDDDHPTYPRAGTDDFVWTVTP